MKLFGYCRPRDFISPPDIGKEIVWTMDRPVTAADVDCGGIMIALGGDGTFLEAVRSLKGLPVPIVGVNTGRLGFLASVPPEKVDALLTDLAAGNYDLQQRSMITSLGDFGERVEFPCALNEFTLHRHTADMIEVEAWVDGQMLATIRGDGVIVSTATGSTAYSLSAGGPIVSPDCRCFILSAIAPHNFSVRPLVVPEESVVELEVHTRGGEVMAALDNASYLVGDGARFTVRKSKYSTFFVRLHNNSFYDTLRDRVMWGLDKRDKKSTFVG